MTDCLEEQEMEAEAMAAIFDSQFSVLGPGRWSVDVFPENSSDGGDSDGAVNHVGCQLLVRLPATYPEEEFPDLDIVVLKGLAEEQRLILKELAAAEAQANMGVPSIFAVTERLREWLLENNVKGLDDVSMHAQMMRKQQQQQRQADQAQVSDRRHTANNFFVGVCFWRTVFAAIFCGYTSVVYCSSCKRHGGRSFWGFYIARGPPIMYIIPSVLE